MNERIPVGVLAGTGSVGQRFIQLLADHPWFEVRAVTGSERSVGRRYGEVVRWIVPGDPPAAVRDLVVQPNDPARLDVSLLFSALPKEPARELEPRFAAAGHAVLTNASAYRMAPDVPLLIPELNPGHTGLIPYQQAARGWSGFIVASPNCSTTSIVLPLKVWHEVFGVTAVVMTTMQAISGAGYPGVASLDIVDNVIPYIGGEDEKLENEPRKLLGTLKDGAILAADIPISAQANRVPVIDGHLVSASVRLARPATVEAAIDAFQAWRPPAIARSLPGSPDPVLIYRPEADRPQPRRDRDAGDGLAWVVGKVRPCPVLDLRLMAITHNTLRGAASGAILNAELLVAQGYIGRDGALARPAQTVATAGT